MSLDYHYVIERPVAEHIVSLPRSRARQLIAFFEYLERNPDLSGQEWCMDEAGRRHEALIFGPVTLVFWTDHALREVRIVQIIED